MGVAAGTMGLVSEHVWPMPASVPPGLRLELSRARVLPGREHVVDEWMAMLHERDAEIQANVAAERAGALPSGYKDGAS